MKIGDLSISVTTGPTGSPRLRVTVGDYEAEDQPAAQLDDREAEMLLGAVQDFLYGRSL